jgi:hypothetical protein
MTETALSLGDIPSVMSHHGVPGLCGDPKNIKEVEAIGGSINIFFISSSSINESTKFDITS